MLTHATIWHGVCATAPSFSNLSAIGQSGVMPLGFAHFSIWAEGTVAGIYKVHESVMLCNSLYFK